MCLTNLHQQFKILINLLIYIQCNYNKLITNSHPYKTKGLLVITVFYVIKRNSITETKLIVCIVK